MNLYQKLVKIRESVPYLQKENAGMQYKYVSSSQVLANCIRTMNELGVLLIPSVVGHRVGESPIEITDNQGRVTKRTITYFTELDLVMRWVNAEKPDEFIECSWYGQGVDIAGEKGVGKALTYAEKYFMLKFFNIATDKDDPDSFQEKHGGEAETPVPATQKQTTKTTKTATKTTKTNVNTTTELPKEPVTENYSGPVEESKSKLSAEQVKRFYTIVSQSGANNDIAKMILDNVLHGKMCLDIVTGKPLWGKVSFADYNKLCSLFESGKWQDYFAKLIDSDGGAQDLRDVG